MQTSMNDSDFDVDEEVGTRVHFENRPENVRDTYKHASNDNRIVSAGNDAFASRVNLKKPES